ncbi:MAG TPA: ATPase, T2SS/T4P/T4SS family [Polyangiaceae bacterium]
MNLEIVIIGPDGSERIERHPDCDVVSIGRDSSCHLCLTDDDRISRRHALLYPEADALRVEDVSSNGTLAGERMLLRQAAAVPYGSPILLGMHTLYVRTSVAAGSAEPQPQPVAGRPPAESTVGESAGSSSPQPPEAIEVSISEVRPITGRDCVLSIAQNQALLRREIHRRLLEHLDLVSLDPKRLDDVALRPRVLTALYRIVQSMQDQLPPDADGERLVGEVADEALGLGPLEALLADASVTEIMLIDPETIYVERAGKLVRAACRFTDEERVRAVIERIVTPLGRRIDECSPLVDARLQDGSRVNAIIAPLALRGSCITIRKFSKIPLTLENLYAFRAISEPMGRFLTRSVVAKRNIVISGGTGSGKTTLLNVLSSAIPADERIVTIEDAAELQLRQPHVVALETRPPNLEGNGAYTIRDLVKNALRMRPDRIVVGECRGGEALDMLQAMNTGHDGSLTTTHANSPAEALARLETLSLMAGVDLPARAIREQIAASVHVVVQQSRLSDGTRKVTDISELCGLDPDGEFELHPIYRFVRSGTDPLGKVEGNFVATGRLPSFLMEFILRGQILPGEPYL